MICFLILIEVGIVSFCLHIQCFCGIMKNVSIGFVRSKVTNSVFPRSLNFEPFYSPGKF